MAYKRIFVTLLKKIDLKRKDLIRRVYSLSQRSKQGAIKRWDLSKMPGFNQLLVKISSGVKVSSDDLLPYISHQSLERRHFVNISLAEAFSNAGNYEQAKVFIQRVWIISKFDEQYLPLFIKIHAACGDISSIREAHKSLGIRAVGEKKIIDALNHFNAWQYAYAIHNGEDEYYYDFDVLNQIELLAKPYSFQLRKRQPIKDRKIRLAYLMFGMTHVSSVIVKNSLTLAKYHNKTLFDVTFFTPDQESLINVLDEAVDNINKIRALGWGVVVAPGSVSEVESLIDISRSIYKFDPDILITNAGLADLKHYFITSLQPAPLVIGLCQGPPPQFVAPDFDWSISWTKHPLIDCPTNCTLISGGVDIPERKWSRVEIKDLFGIPKESLVVISSGRPSKFLDVNFWVTIIDVIRCHPNVYFVAVGLAGRQPSFLQELLTADIVGRVKIIGWEKDFLKVLSMADVAIDTYPSGGGVSIIDTMALGTPVISFKNNYMNIFSQKDWSPAEEFMGMPELMIDRGDFDQLYQLLSKMLTDHEFRENLSNSTRARIIESSGNKERMVEDCERVYLNVIEKNYGSNFGAFFRGIVSRDGD